MKFSVKWTATYETNIEASTLEEARDEASAIDITVPGSNYLEDSWEVLDLSGINPPPQVR